MKAARNLFISLSAKITKSDLDAALMWRHLSPFLLKASSSPIEFTVSGSPLIKKALGRQEKILVPDEIDRLIKKYPTEYISLIGIGPTSRKLALSDYSEKTNTRSIRFAGTYEELGHEMKLVAEDLCKWSNPLVIIQTKLGLYNAWQNTKNIKSFENQFGSIDGFKIVPLGPPPVDFPSLDILMNPGREWPDGIMDCCVNADMWLGPRFWEFAPCKKEEVMAADFFLEKREMPNCLYLKSWQHPFTRPDGEQGRIQQKLWRLLFHQDCEWPPGSGGISDEPIGGPPEFMPPGILD
jgi:hypothetical protein